MPEETESPEQIFSNQGIPFSSEQRARAAIEQKGLSLDGYTVQSYEEGYIIVPKPKPKSEKYYRIIFSHKTSPNDEDDVTLIVNGETLVIQRGVETIIPERYKECADHATYPVFRQRPNETRKQVGSVMVFPYSLTGEATEAEYRKLLKEGNKKTRESIEADNKLM